MMHSSDDKALAIQQDWQLDIEPEPQMPSNIIADESFPPGSESQSVPEDTPPPLPRILEGLLFVADEPVLPDRICQIIRGLTAEQFQETIQQLNYEYRHQARPYRIDREGSGYRLRLRNRFHGTLEKVYGGLKEARFSTAAVEVLAVIAYRQPITKAALDVIRGHESDVPLRQLLRRGLVTQLGTDEQNQPRFGITSRFLKFFHLDKLDELPLADDLERI